MSSKIVTRHSSCGELNLPHLSPDNLACIYCKPSIIKTLEKGGRPKRINKYSQPWASGQIIVNLQRLNYITK